MRPSRPLFVWSVVALTLSLGIFVSFRPTHTLVVVDASVPDAAFFVQHATKNTTVVLLDAGQNGLKQIDAVLKQHPGMTDLQIVSHGASGHVYLGSSDVDSQFLADHAATLASWRKNLAPHAQITLLGCNVASGDAGKAFIQTFASLTHADIAASNDVTGSGSNWAMEAKTGRSVPSLAFDAGLFSYAYTLNHFRYGTMSYTYLTGRDVLIKLDNGWTNSHGFIPLATPIGGVVSNAFTLTLGDGTTTSVNLRVTSRDATNNDVQTEAVTLSGATYITGIKHTYPTDGNYTVFWSSSTRESATGQATGTWRTEMKVVIGNANSSPVVAVPAVVQVQDDTIFNYQLVAVDPNGDQLRFRLGTQQEFYANSNNSNVAIPTGMTMSSTGSIRWDVRNTVLTTSAGARWQMTVMVEDLTSTGAVKSKVPIDFVFVISNNAPPRFVTYPTGTQAATIGVTTSVTLTSTDPNWLTGYSSPTINALNPPSTTSSVWTGALVRASSGATYTVDFNPTEGMAGQTFVVIFRTTNSSGGTAVQAVTFLVPGSNQAPSNITLSNNTAVEHSPTGTVIGTLAATDIDIGDTHTFSLVGATDTAIFALGAGSGSKLKVADAAHAGSGTYSVTVRATDSGGLMLDKTFTVKLWEDDDADLIADYHDALIGDRSYVTAQGTTNLTVKVGGSTASGTYTGSRTTLFTDGLTDLFSFVPNYDNVTIHLANVLVKKGINSLVVNTGNELPAGTKKTMYLDDNGYISLCAKDEPITSESEISSTCTDVGEIDFTSCIGSSGGVTLSGITCTDEGARYRFDGLSHSGLMGTPPPDASSSTQANTGGGTQGGGNRHGLSISDYLARLTPATHPAATDTSAVSTECDTKDLFNDVQSNDWYARYVCYLKAADVISGYKDKEGNNTQIYGPANRFTYAELSKMALLASGTRANWNGKPANLSAREDWSAPYIRTMEGLKIPLFTPSFVVQVPATRADVISIALQMFDIAVTKHTSSSFTDLPLTDARANALLTAVDLGIVQGDLKSDGTSLHTMRPNDSMNRAEIAKVFYLLMSYDESHQQ